VRSPKDDQSVLSEASEDVIRACRNGDVAALGEVYRIYGDRIYRLCLRITGNACDAEDGVQQVFLRLLGHSRKFSGRSRFSTWLFRLAVNTSLNALRSRGRRQLPSLSDLPESEVPAGADPSPEDRAIRSEQASQAARLLDALEPAHRCILLLRELEGQSYREIADILEIPVGTVMSRLARARERLAERVAEIELPQEENPGPRNRPRETGVKQEP